MIYYFYFPFIGYNITCRTIKTNRKALLFLVGCKVPFVVFWFFFVLHVLGDTWQKQYLNVSALDGRLYFLVHFYTI